MRKSQLHLRLHLESADIYYGHVARHVVLAGAGTWRGLVLVLVLMAQVTSLRCLEKTPNHGSLEEFREQGRNVY